MSTDAKAVWLSYNTAENASDFDTMMRLVAPDLKVTVNGRAAVASAADDERAMRELKATYPDYRRQVEEVLGFGDRAVARWRMLGTPERSGAPTLQIHGCSVVRVVGDVMTEAHLYYEGATLDAVLDRVRARS